MDRNLAVVVVVMMGVVVMGVVVMGLRYLCRSRKSAAVEWDEWDEWDERDER